MITAKEITETLPHLNYLSIRTHNALQDIASDLENIRVMSIFVEKLLESELSEEHFLIKYNQFRSERAKVMYKD